MDRTERFYKIELLIRNRGGVNFKTLREALDVSAATLKRDLQYLRDRLDAPIVYERGTWGPEEANALTPNHHWFTPHVRGADLSHPADRQPTPEEAAR